MLEDFLSAFQNFKHNKLRSCLSLLGIIIGVASVIVVTTLGNSAAANVKSSFNKSGLDLVQISSGWIRNATSSTIKFDDSFRTVVERFPESEQVFYNYNLSGSIRYGATEGNVTTKAVEPGYLEMSGIEADIGALLTDADDYYGTHKAVIGSEVMANFFPDGDALNKILTLDLNGVRFGLKVAGVLKSQTSAGMEQPDNMVYVTSGFYKKKIDPDPDAGNIVIKAASQDVASQLKSRIEEYAAKTTGNQYALRVMSMQSMMEQFDEIMGTLSLMLGGVAAISLLVGGIGIMNIMIVSVTERKKEIGIRKALGASPAVIRNQFLIESASISLFGGILGIFFGIVISYVVVLVLGWVFSVQIGACLSAFLFSAAVGVFFGLSPAIKAARLDPVEALSAD